MKLVECLRRSFIPCFNPQTSGPDRAPYPAHYRAATVLPKNHQDALAQEEDSLIDAAATCTDSIPFFSSTRSIVVGTIYGHRRGRVSFCVQNDPATPPPFLYDLSLPTQLLADEMRTGTLRIALECHRPLARRRLASPAWRLCCNGRSVGYASKRRPNEKDVAVLRKVRVMSAGTGVIRSLGEEEGELIYMRASYARVVGSRDPVSYHLINPSGGSPSQELSIFLLRTR